MSNATDEFKQHLSEAAEWEEKLVGLAREYATAHRVHGHRYAGGTRGSYSFLEHCRDALLRHARETP